MPIGEHQILVDELDRALHRYSRTGLLGVAEAECRKFDYGCLLLRDMLRPLVAQALWAHERGIEKGLRTLLLDREAVPTFKSALNTRPTVRFGRALTMLVASGFVRRIARTNVCIPPVKDRLMLDLTRRLLFECKSGRKEWSPETRQILAALGLEESITPQGYL
jgi:hypothetical protein